jgi:hypothetical protein
MIPISGRKAQNDATQKTGAYGQTNGSGFMTFLVGGPTPEFSRGGSLSQPPPTAANEVKPRGSVNGKRRQKQ